MEGWERLILRHLPGNKVKMKYLVLLTVVFMVSGLFLPEGCSAQNLEIWFIWANGASGTSTLIRGPNGTVVLYDEMGGYTGAYYLDQLLDDLGITYIDYAIAGHYDADHCGGLDNLSSLLGGDSHFGTYYDRGGSWRNNNTAIPSDYYGIVNGNPKRMTPTLGPAGALDLGAGATLTFLSMGAPDYSTGEDYTIYVYNRANITSGVTENEKSITALLTYRGFDLYIGSDAEGDVEGVIKNVIVEDFDRQPDICLVDHHGSASNGTSSPSFCEKMDPEVAVISVWNNMHEHPRRATVTNFHNVVEQLPQRILRLSPGDDTVPNDDWAPEDMYSECYTTNRHIYVHTNGRTYTVDTVDRTGGNDITEPGLIDHPTDQMVDPTPSPTPAVCTRIDEGFNGFDTGTRPSGWTFTNCNLNSDSYTTAGNYGNQSPSLKLDATGDSIETDVFSRGEWLQFWVKGQGTDSTSHLLVEEYRYSFWSEITDISSLPLTGRQFGVFILNPSTSQIKFTYTKSVGCLAFDDVMVKCLFTPTATSTITPTPTLTPTPPIPPLPTATPKPSDIPPPSPSPTAATSPSPTATPLTPLQIPDFNGDGSSDIAVFRPTSGLWAIRGITRVYFGGASDQTVPDDYNGDGTTDIGIFRRASGLWAIRFVTRTYFGSGLDLPIPGDYDGDGTAGIGIFRATSGLWAIRGITRAYFGATGDIPVSGYYTGTETRDIGIFRGSSGLWAIKGLTRVYFGSSIDEAVPGDYNGSGHWSVGIFRPGSGLWAVRGVTRSYFGSVSDRPVTADYAGKHSDSIGIFRAASGLWAVREVTRVYFGMSNDIPIARPK